MRGFYSAEKMFLKCDFLLLHVRACVFISVSSKYVYVRILVNPAKMAPANNAFSSGNEEGGNGGI